MDAHWLVPHWVVVWIIVPFVVGVVIIAFGNLKQ